MLIVDDDPRVRAARCGGRAIGRFKGRSRPGGSPPVRKRRHARLYVIAQIHQRQPRTACIVVTACGDPAIELHAMRFGADAFLQKPAPLQLLPERVAGLLDELQRPAVGGTD
jgi:hypothetical protein